MSRPTASFNFRRHSIDAAAGLSGNDVFAMASATAMSLACVIPAIPSFSMRMKWIFISMNSRDLTFSGVGAVAIVIQRDIGDSSYGTSA